MEFDNASSFDACQTDTSCHGNCNIINLMFLASFSNLLDSTSPPDFLWFVRDMSHKKTNINGRYFQDSDTV